MFMQCIMEGYKLAHLLSRRMIYLKFDYWLVETCLPNFVICYWCSLVTNKM